LGTTKTSERLIFGVGKKVPTWVIGKKASLPTITQSLPLYGSTLSSWEESGVICAAAPVLVYQSAAMWVEEQG